MSIKKQLLKSKPICKVSFKVGKAEAEGASQLAILGDFNGWDASANVMEKLKDGSFSHTIELETGKSYSFRYLADKQRWFNEADADDKVANEFGGQNSVIKA